MTSILVVHGTGSRGQQYTDMYEEIRRRLVERHPSLSAGDVLPCPWGDTAGSRLNGGGASIPEYDTTKGIGGVRPEDYELVLWHQLYQDPFYELRLLALANNKPGGVSLGQEPPGRRLDRGVRNLQPTATTGLETALKQGGMFDSFIEARTKVVRSDAYLQSLQDAPQALNDYRTAIARAIVAQFVADCLENDTFAPVIWDAALRDKVIEELTGALGNADKGIGSWIGKQLIYLAAKVGVQELAQRKRGALTDAVSPAAGDIIMYQGRGDAIRSFIRDHINAASSPVIVLAHSLGGVACVDLLTMEDMSNKVPLLITVGSQAPLFYELDALYSLGYGSPLPPHFPKRWLNIYDLQDFLSYTASKVFPHGEETATSHKNRPGIEDVEVDNGQPFPLAHSAYWFNPHTWDAIEERLREEEL